MKPANSVSPVVTTDLARAAWARTVRRYAAAAGVLASAVVPLAASAQTPLVGYRTGSIGVTYEHWSFGDGGFLQPTVDGSGMVHITGSSQLSIPISATVPVSDKWTLDLSGAYASGTVSLSGRDSVLDTDHYSLNGVTDVRVRATGHLVGDNVLVTLGLNLPTGKTSLNANEFSALRIIGAPALTFQTPVLGIGTGATAGVVLARQIDNWAWALGTSFELRRTYAPVTLAAGIPAPDFSPGNAVHLSLGTDGFIGQNGMTVSLSADFYGKSKLAAFAEATAPGESLSPAGATTTQLGPIFTANWQLRVAARGFREFTLYAVDHYRRPYKRSGVTTSGSSGNYLDAGVESIYAATPSTGVLVGLDLHHQTGLSVDNTMATSAVRSGALTLGLVHDLPGGYTIRPFVRGQLGKLVSGSTSTNATGFAGGVTLGARF
ncbi:MAG TPA: hypothetical protein VFW98_00195 [Gemmatimonadaceae bacterium]|nr:hypothetical protein [Gemmatimonadaceae bacterium]